MFKTLTPKLFALLGEIAGWLLGLFWKYTEEKVEEEVKANPGITQVDIPGMGKVPLETFNHISKVVPHVTGGLKAGKTPEEIYSEVKANVLPDVIAIVDDVVGLVCPPLGTLLKLITFLYEHGQPWTPEEEKVWMDRFGAGSQS